MANMYLDSRSHFGFTQIFENPEVLNHFLNILITHGEGNMVYAPKLVQKSQDHGDKRVIHFLNFMAHDAKGDNAPVLIVNASAPEAGTAEAYQHAFRFLMRISAQHLMVETAHSIMLHYGEYDEERRKDILKNKAFCQIIAAYRMGDDGQPDERWTPGQLSYVLEIGLFNLSWEECTTPLDKWMYQLKHLGTFTHTPEEEQDPGLQALLNAARYTSAN